MKNTTHSNSVTRVRPSRKRCSTGIPESSGSWTTNGVAGANTARGLMDPKSSATRSCARPVSARNRTDSGSRRARIGTSSSGASPPTTNTERQGREHDDLLAPDPVGKRPEHERADHQSEQAGAEHRTERGLAHAPFPGERRRDKADGLGVEAIEEQHGRAGQQQSDLKSADRLRIDELGDIDRRWAASNLNRHRCPSLKRRTAVLLDRYS